MGLLKKVTVSNREAKGSLPLPINLKLIKKTDSRQKTSSLDTEMNKKIKEGRTRDKWPRAQTNDNTVRRKAAEGKEESKTLAQFMAECWCSGITATPTKHGVLLRSWYP